MLLLFRWLVVCVVLAGPCLTVGPSQRCSAESYKELPPAGVEIDSANKQKLRSRLETLEREIDQQAAKSDDAEAWTPDVFVFTRSVRLALEQNLFFKKSSPDAADEILDAAAARLQAAASGKRGLELMGYSPLKVDKPQTLVGGFVSDIDDSVQPYGLVVPAGYKTSTKQKHRLDIWLHGRGDTKTEIPFLRERMTKPGQYTPKDTFVLHPFGRHCNAFKFAGERDVYESLQHTQALVPIDSNRISVRGFSMGGAGCWHFGVHDPTRWFAVNPGAGFVDTLVYQGWKQSVPFPMTDVQQKLLHWYDVLPWTNNLRNTNTIAYSGEVDKQKLAADRVFAESSKHGFTWPYVIGKKMGHKINPESANTIQSQLALWSATPKKSPQRFINFTTYTLRYARAGWINVTGLKQHWSKSQIRAEFDSAKGITIQTSGVTHFELDFQESGWGSDLGNTIVKIDGETIEISDSGDQPGLQACFVKNRGWHVDPKSTWQLRKHPGLQGPIDDALTSKFLFVMPSRPARNGIVERWINRESKYAMTRWRQIMRGDINTVLDTELTDEQIKSCNLICFGDFSGNRFLNRISSQLPIDWNRDKLVTGQDSYSAADHVAVFCYPNPANPSRYVVANSGLTFRKFSNTSNSRQIAMLPDWAIMKVGEPHDDAIFAGQIVRQGFFDEQWKLAGQE